MAGLTQALLKSILKYDPQTGGMTWLERPRRMFTSDGAWASWNTRFAGTKAGYRSEVGYWRINYLGTIYLAHRLAWLYMTGEYAENVDHINADKSDNRFVNLRNVAFSENCKNLRMRADNRSGVVGVNFASRRNKWVSTIRVEGKTIYLGGYSTIEEAAAARKVAEAKYGFHPNHGLSKGERHE